MSDYAAIQEYRRRIVESFAVPARMLVERPMSTADDVLRQQADGYARMWPTLVSLEASTRKLTAVFSVYAEAKVKQWNWRRTKRELRKIGLVRKGVRR